MNRSTLLFTGLFCLLLQATMAQAEAPSVPKVIRLNDGPIIVPHMDDRMGANIQGPSLIRVPDWIDNPMGEYYLYFADHRGKYIRLAYANDLLGPWSTYEPGTLQLEQSYFPSDCSPCAYAHIASPDVHIDEERQEIVMYVHGRDVGRQLTRSAVSKDGLQFEGREEVLGRPYFRVVQHDAFHYALAMPGYLYRSRDGSSNFEEGPRFFNDDMRHSALLIRNNQLHVFWTQRRDAPERIFLSTIDLRGDWMNWQESEPVEILRPQLDWEGASLAVEPSRGGYIDERVNQLRDPAIYEEDGEIFLLYSVAGESGIAIVQLEFD